MQKHISKGIEYKEGDTVQHFHDGEWWSGELKYDGFMGWYVDFPDGEKMVKDWSKIRENILTEPHGFKRVQIGNFASARVSENCSEEVIEALMKMAALAYNNAEELILKVDKK